MSEIKVDNLNGKTSAGNITVTSEGGAATMQLQQGLAKFWINFTGLTTTSIRDSFNVSSVTDNGTGDTTISYTSSLSAAYNYSMADYTAYYGNLKFASFRGLGGSNKLASSVNVQSGYVSGTGGQLGAEDIGEMNLIIHGDLA